MRLTIQGRTLTAALAIVTAGHLAANMAWSEEPKERCERCCEGQATSQLLFSRIPYLNRLFKNTEVQADCDAAFERIGIDFEAIPGRVIEFHAPADGCPQSCSDCPQAVTKLRIAGFDGVIGDCRASCPAYAVPATGAMFVVRAKETCGDGVCAASAKCGSESKCCADGKCCAAGKCCIEGKCCAAKSNLAKEKMADLWEHVAELTAERAAMEATLESQEAVLQAKSEMFESLAELMVEKAKLEAKLEMVEHRDSMLKEMVELQAENARLKAQAELAQQKEELLKSQLATVLENERLKQRVAELEQRHNDGESPVLADKKQPKTKKVR